MRRVSFLLLVPLAACASTRGPEDIERLAGHYRYGFEVESFRPCGSSEDWWVTVSDRLRERIREIGDAPGPVYAVLRARVSPQGEYGHLGSYDRQISIVEVLEVRPATETDCPSTNATTAAVPGDAPERVEVDTRHSEAAALPQ
jgi:hypothetical protein